MKKVIAISSSGRKRNTYRLIESTRKRLEEADIELEIIHLADFTIQDCCGCDACILVDKCPIKDDCHQLFEKLESADGLIVTSPVYMASVSGQLKRFIDRTCRWYHRPVLVGKPVLLMTTTAGGYADDVLNYLHKVTMFWGMRQCGRIKRSVKSWGVEASEQELILFIKAVKQEPRSSWIPNMNEIITFQVQKALAHHILPRDQEYWKQKQWSERVYYEGSHLPFYKKWLGKSFYRLLSHSMSKHQKKVPK